MVLYGIDDLESIFWLHDRAYISIDLGANERELLQILHGVLYS